MGKKLVIISLIIFISVIAYFISWFDYILILAVVLVLAFLILIGLISIFRKLTKKFYKLPLVILVVCVFGLIVSLFRPYDKAIINSNNTSENLKYAYETDQSDRKELKSFIGYFSRLEERDNIRLNQVKKLRDQEELSKSMDMFYAAFVYHHSDNKEDYKIASELAARAAVDNGLKDNYLVQWLRKASYDRYMLSIGKPEKYNTQNNFSMDIE
ncbi:MAG: hypothetical protein WA951_11290 [Leeuwenhoekiella sp.]